MTPTNAQETVQESLARHAMRETQPPKSPLSGSSLNSPLVRGLGKTNIEFLHNLSKENDDENS